MPPGCSEQKGKHRSGACRTCKSGVCHDCCSCRRKTRGRPSQSDVRPRPVAYPTNAAIHRRHSAATADVLGTAIPHEGTSHHNCGSQDFICHVLSLLGTEAGSDISHIPSVDHRKAARVKEDLTADGFRRIQSIFWKGVKGWIKLLLPAWNLPDDKVLKKIFHIPGTRVQNEADANVGVEAAVESSSHSIVATNIIEAIKHEKSFHTLRARQLLAPFGTLPTKFWLEHFNIKETLVAELKFQAQVDAEYQRHGLSLQQYPKSFSRIKDSVIKCLVDFVYSDENVTRLAWAANKHKDKRFSELQYVAAMKSLVLKYDVATMYRMYLETVEVQAGQNVVGKSLFRNIVQNITGGGIKQDRRAGVDYVKVNYHTDNFALLDMAIKSLMSGTDCAQRDEILYQRNVVFDFLSYGYSQHVIDGVKAQYELREAAGSMEQLEHNISLLEKQQFHQYNELHSMAECPDDFDSPVKQQAFIDRVKAQLNACAKIHGHTGVGATSHTPSYTLDLAKDHVPRTDHQKIGFLECSACRGPYLFYDKLRHSAVARFEKTDTMLLSDLLLTIHQCERRTFRYMAHVVQKTQQHHLMHLVRSTLGGDTMYVVFDFKQKFLSKGFREGGDAYYGKKGMLWFGAAAYIKHQHNTGCERSYIGAKNYGNAEEGNVTHTFMDDGAVEDQHIHEVKETHGDDMMDEEVTDDEEMTLDNENEGVMLDDENEEVTLDDDENEEVTLDDENEEETLDDENEEVTLDDENEEVTLNDENEEVTLNDENEEVTSDDENEEDLVTSDDENEEVINEKNDVSETGTSNECCLHFVDSIVDGDEKADSSVALSCLEATFHVLRQHFPHVRKVILQSDNAKTFGGNVTTQLLPLVAKAAGLECTGYYHNEAGTGKDVCDTHFSHQQARVNAYISEGSGGRKVSTAKQLVAALASKLIKNTTVLLLKPDFKAPFRTSTLKTISGIAGFYASEYITTGGIAQQVTTLNLFRNMGQYIPSKTVTLPVIQPASMDVNPFQQAGVNFTGVNVLMSSDLCSDMAVLSKAQHRYKKRKRNKSASEQKREKREKEAAMKLGEVKKIYPQCNTCKYHFKSEVFLKKHACCGAFQSKDALSVAMRYADTILATRDFSLSGCIANMSTLFSTSDSLPHATFECNFRIGWAQVRKAMHPIFSIRVQQFIARCWQEGIASRAKVSAEAVVVRLTDEHVAGRIRLAELPVVGQVRTSYQAIGQSKDVPGGSAQGKKRRGHSYKDLRNDEPAQKKKQKMLHTAFDWSKPLLKWSKPQLQTYLTEHNVNKTGNKPELIERVKACMHS